MRLSVCTFRHGTDTDVARKVVEEAAEAFSAWESLDLFGGEDADLLDEFADELADCITACANLAERYGLDMQAALDRVERKNRERGRYD